MVTGGIGGGARGGANGMNGDGPNARSVICLVFKRVAVQLTLWTDAVHGEVDLLELEASGELLEVDLLLWDTAVAQHRGSQSMTSESRLRSDRYYRNPISVSPLRAGTDDHFVQHECHWKSDRRQVQISCDQK